MPAGAIAENPDKSVRIFQLEMLSLQMTHEYRIAYYSAIFGVGASFEVFALTLFITAVLIVRDLSSDWWVWALIGIYLLTGIGFVSTAVWGFARTKRLQGDELKRLTVKYT